MGSIDPVESFLYVEKTGMKASFSFSFGLQEGIKMKRMIIRMERRCLISSWFNNIKNTNKYGNDNEEKKQVDSKNVLGIASSLRSSQGPTLNYAFRIIAKSCYQAFAI